ncbi:MAG: DEAD/DEAH box helicase [Oscillospiraceae bacterium]|nr:DEAD/DEAH box helicase [Oscillospiraceae bacterium]
MTFQDLGLCPPILSALRALDYEKPSPIQAKAIPPALQGRDVLGCAQTGTGKTCAFATPILQQLHGRKPEPHFGVRPIRALILTPTRELALQIQESFEAYGKNLPLRSAVIFGGVGQQPQVDKLKAGVDILVATPGRLEDLHNQGFIHVEKLEIFVLDEADRMLDMGFIHDVKKILTWLPKKKQTLFFSATMPPEVQGLVDSLLVDPVKVAVDPVSSPVEVIDQRLFYVDRSNKSKLLAMLVKHPEVKNALIFTRTKHGANKVAGDLAKAGIPSAAIHGNKSQTARQQALADFKSGRIKALVATDIAARGIDIEELSHVFNYNLPDVPETYVHRIGRTGRAGHGGTAVSFCEFGEKELLAPIEKLLKKPIPVVEGHPYPMENFEAPKRDKHGKIVNPDDQEARQAARERKKQRDAAKSAHPATAAAPKAPSVGRDAPARQTPKKSSVGRGLAPAAPTSTASVKKQAGYRPSKTLDQALSAMSPKSPKGRPAPGRDDQARRSPSPKHDPAYEAWLAEERAIQAQRFRDDPLAGDTIMDATARFLAPKSTAPSAGRGSPSAAHDAPARRAAQAKRSPAGGRTTAPSADRGSPTAAHDDPARRPTQAKRSPTGGRTTSASVGAGSKPARPASPKESPKREQKRRPDRRRGPMEPTLRLGSQKDSTEQQGSLMRPYYFNPDED